MASRIKQVQGAIRKEISGLRELANSIDSRTHHLIQEIITTQGFLIFTGVGKSGHICHKLASTFTSLGTRSIYIHPTEAAHGDMGLITKEDLLLVMSRSGAAIECMRIIERARELNCPTYLVAEKANSALGSMVGTTVEIPQVDEAWGHAPTTSTIMQMAYGDALAIAVAEAKGFTTDDFRKTHPGGILGC